MNLKISDIHYGTQTLITNIITNVLPVIPDTITINTFVLVLFTCLASELSIFCLYLLVDSLFWLDGTCQNPFNYRHSVKYASTKCCRVAGTV